MVINHQMKAILKFILKIEVNEILKVSFSDTKIVEQSEKSQINQFNMHTRWNSKQLVLEISIVMW